VWALPEGRLHERWAHWPSTPSGRRTFIDRAGGNTHVEERSLPESCVLADQPAESYGSDVTAPSIRTTLIGAAEQILGLTAGELAVHSSGSPVSRLGEALADRNLGLVRVAEPQRFGWAGHWIGVIEHEGSELAVVMFGVPSAIVGAPPGVALDAQASLVAGYVIAPLDLHRRHERAAYGTADGAGTIVGIYTAADREAACVSVDRCPVRAGRGIDGDRYATGRGTFWGAERNGQDLTLIESEALQELRDATGIDLEPGAARRNVVTRGIRLEPLIGSLFTIGDVRCRAVRLAEPCAVLQRLTEPGVLRGLVHRGGIRVDVLDDGELRVGAPIRPA
jgi:MOSC domain